MLNFLFIVSF